MLLGLLVPIVGVVLGGMAGAAMLLGWVSGLIFTVAFTTMEDHTTNEH